MRRIWLLMAVLCVILAAGLALTPGTRPTVTIMTVPKAIAALQLHPATWSGRAVFVRGWTSVSIGQGCAVPQRGGRPASGQFTCSKVWVLLSAAPASSGAGGFAPYSSSSPGLFPVLLRQGGFDPDRLDIAAVVGGLLRQIPRIGPLLAPWGGSHILHVDLTMTPGTCPPLAVLTPGQSASVLRCPGGIEVP